MEKENLIGKIKNLNIKAFLLALTVLSAWFITGSVLTNSIDFELEYLISGLSAALLIPLVYFWEDMDSPAGETWRNIIGAGIFVNLSAAILVLLDAYSTVIAELSVLYWIAVPGYGLMVNANFIQKSSRRYALLSHFSSVAAVAYLIGFFQLMDWLILISACLTGSVQALAAYTSMEIYLE